MSTLGKVLLFINLVIAAGVAYLASGAWAKRQEQNTALLKLGLLESGLPLYLVSDKKEDATIGRSLAMDKDDTKVPFEIPTAAGRTASSVSVKVLKEHFGGAKGEYIQSPNPPPSVWSEVDEIKRNFDTKVAGQQGPLGKLAFLIGQDGPDKRLVPGPLTLLADDYEERVMFRSWLTKASDEKAKEEDRAKYTGFATAAVARKFNEVMAAADPSAATASVTAVLEARKRVDEAFDAYKRADVLQRVQTKAALDAAEDELAKVMTAPVAATSDLERRRKAGAIFIALGWTNADAQKRAALVLGVRDYTAAVQDRVARLRVMPERYERAVEAELGQFVAQYEQRLNAAKDLDRLLVKQLANSESFKASAERLRKLVDQRAEQRTAAANEAAAVEAAVTTASAAQGEIEKALLQLQKEAGALLSKNFVLEDQLYQAEKQKANK